VRVPGSLPRPHKPYAYRANGAYRNSEVEESTDRAERPRPELGSASHAQTFEARDLRADQRGTVLEILRELAGMML
jgi:hypothetical protein